MTQKLNSFQLKQLREVDLMRERLIMEVNEQSERLVEFIKSRPKFNQSPKCKCYVRTIYDTLRIPARTVTEPCDVCSEIVKKGWLYIRRSKYN